MMRNPSARSIVSLRPLRVAAAMLVSVLLLSCANVPDPILVDFPPHRSPPAAASGEAAAKVLLVRRLSVPEYMVARRVRYWAGSGTMAEWPNAYWAERIEIGMARELVAALHDRLPGWTICDATCADAAPDLMLRIELLRLDVLRNERRIDAAVEIDVSAPAAGTAASPQQSASTRAAAYARTLSVPLAGDSAEGEAQALADLLDKLAEASMAPIRETRAPAIPRP